jgi:hypothetical protein
VTFVAGQSGNPHGRAAEKPFLAALRVAIAKAKQSRNPKHSLEKIAERLLINAAAGETAAIREIADRLDGKIPAPAVIQDDVKLIVEIRSFPPLPDTPSSAAQRPKQAVIEHQPIPPPDAEIVELPTFLPAKK